MDMQKEREAFEAWISEVCPHVKMDLNAKTECEYDSSSMSLAWYAWQAAKASAVPEGYCIVPKEPSDTEIEAIRERHWSLRGCQLCKPDYLQLYKAMIEAAQEQGYDL